MVSKDGMIEAYLPPSIPAHAKWVTYLLLRYWDVMIYPINRKISSASSQPIAKHLCLAIGYMSECFSNLKKWQVLYVYVA